MKKSLYIAFVLCFLNMMANHAAAMPVSFPYESSVTLCEFDVPQTQLPTFDEIHCKNAQLVDVDPQNKALWVRFKFSLGDKLDTLPRPYGLYFFGKASSEIYLNGQALGQNGVPAYDDSEIAGNMDTVFAIPYDLLQAEGNELIMHLSAQHSIINLGYPIHFIGIGQFGEPRHYIQQSIILGVALFGAFIVGAFYFFVLSLGQYAKTSSRFFAALCTLAALQLGTEMSRALVNYPYPWQDLRLIIVTVFSTIFGLLLLGYSSNKVARKQAVHWFYTGLLLTIITVISVPGFDTKTTTGVFVPLLVSLSQLIYFWYRNRESRLLRWFAVQFLVAATIVLAQSSFHEIVYFIIVGVLLCYLFVQQANEYKEQQKQLIHDQSQIAKLEFQLAHQAQTKTPMKLDISIGGKTEFITTNNIAYCKAAGDYVELHMNNLDERLYSGTLKQLETVLPSTFVRVHRSYLVNLEEVVSLGDTQSQSNLLSLTNEQRVPVSRRLLPAVRESLKSMLH